MRIFPLWHIDDILQGKVVSNLSMKSACKANLGRIGIYISLLWSSFHHNNGSAGQSESQQHTYISADDTILCVVSYTNVDLRFHAVKYMTIGVRNSIYVYIQTKIHLLVSLWLTLLALSMIVKINLRKQSSWSSTSSGTRLSESRMGH